jgi:phage tail-like protein
MAVTQRKDPLPAFCFRVSLDALEGKIDAAFFKSVSGLKFEREPVPFKAGGVDNPFNLIGSAKLTNLVLKQGFLKDSRLLEWASSPPEKMVRSDGKIEMLNTAFELTGTWKFKRGWPCKWEISELDASKNEIVIETLEIAHEGLTYEAAKPRATSPAGPSAQTPAKPAQPPKPPLDGMP